MSCGGYGGLVPVPLTLGVPKRREDRPLTARLLLVSGDDGMVTEELAPMIGDRVVPLSELPPPADAPAGVIGAVDLREASTFEPPPGLALHIDCTPHQVSTVLELPVTAAVFVAGAVDVELVRAITAAGFRAGIDFAAPVEQVADFLAVLAHADTGFVGRVRTGREALAAIAATVAALRGDDVRAAFTDPDAAALARLNPDAAAAVREVLIGIEVTDSGSVARDLAALSNS